MCGLHGTPEDARQLIYGIGLVHELEAMPTFLGKHLAVAGCEHHRQARLAASDLLAELNTAPTRHHDIREHDVEVPRRLFEEF